MRIQLLPLSAFFSFRKNNRVQSGFTIVELLIVIGVMAILSGLGIASYSKYDTTQRFQEATNNTVNLLEIAKSKSASQVILYPQPACPVFSGWAFSIVNSSTYTLYTLCNMPPTNGDFKESTQYRGTLASSVRFDTLTDGTSPNNIYIVFQPLSGRVFKYKKVGATFTPITGNIVIKQGSSTHTITVDNNGNISVL